MLRLHGLHERNISATWFLITRLTVCSEPEYHLPSGRVAVPHRTSNFELFALRSESVTSKAISWHRGALLFRAKGLKAGARNQDSIVTNCDTVSRCLNVFSWLVHFFCRQNSALTTSAILKQRNEFILVLQKGKKQYEIMRKNFRKLS
jgi:hypothetical protein